MNQEEASLLYHAINYTLLGMSKVDSTPPELAQRLMETRNKLVIEHKLIAQDENPFNDYTTAFGGDPVAISPGKENDSG